MESTDLVVPHTGEVLPLEDPARCALLYQEIRELEYRLRDTRAALADALIEESAKQGTKTLHFPGVEAKITGGNETSWDYEVLLELQDAGLPEERFTELVHPEVEYKVNGLVARSIAGSNPVYAEIIERAKTQRPKPAGVTVSRKGAK
jgi:hypothetical protein